MDRKTQKWIKLMDFAQCTGCHQRADRSFFYKGWQFPVCARCTGVFIGQILSCVVLLKKNRPVKTAFAGCAVMFIDWLLQELGIKESTNKRRLVTGVLGGFGFSFICLCMFKKAIVQIKQSLGIKWF